MQLHSGKDLRVPHSLVITKLSSKEEEQLENVHSQATKSTPVRQPEPTQIVDEEPPFPQRQAIKEPETMSAFDFLDQLKHVCVKIPLFQEIKDVPIYSKAIRSMFLKKPGRKRKYPQTVHVMGQLADIMLGKAVVTKYSDPGSPVVELTINGLADSLTVTPDRVVEDLIVTLDSWEYPTNFMILSPKATLGEYPVILGRPWIAIADAYIGCRFGDMTISNGNTTKKLILFPPAKPHEEDDTPVWPDLGDEVEEVNSLKTLIMIGRSSILKLQDDNEILSQIIQNNYELGTETKNYLSCSLQMYGVPRELVTNQGPQFTSTLISTLVNEYNIRHKKSIPYHLQANDQAEVTNREIEAILTGTVALHKKDWATRLPKAVWTYRITWKTTTGFTPFEILYGKTTILPIEFELRLYGRTLI
ncbi:uncharacterized protein LOC131874162 [Cryptomeria japonica]|uniref:uncharacterized protein LOC131874162 n=1 Tax=Cryptomeria japonica TaxID=3369 RepID=UPI0027DA255D|nr:uncharacterized protein LOC131874162 [Cryptomeria japonica]